MSPRLRMLYWILNLEGIAWAAGVIVFFIHYNSVMNTPADLITREAHIHDAYVTALIGGIVAGAIFCFVNQRYQNYMLWPAAFSVATPLRIKVRIVEATAVLLFIFTGVLVWVNISNLVIAAAGGLSLALMCLPWLLDAARYSESKQRFSR